MMNYRLRYADFMKLSSELNFHINLQLNRLKLTVRSMIKLYSLALLAY